MQSEKDATEYLEYWSKIYNISLNKGENNYVKGIYNVHIVNKYQTEEQLIKVYKDRDQMSDTIVHLGQKEHLEQIEVKHNCIRNKYYIIGNICM